MRHTPVENFVIFVALLLLYIKSSAQQFIPDGKFKVSDLYADVADPSRIVYFAGKVENSVDQAFAKVDIKKVKDKACGELVVAQKQGYSPFIGFVGAASFPLFHTQLDDASTTSPALLDEMSNAIKPVIETELARDGR